MYTKKQNKKIEKVLKVFADYIRSTDYFDVVWSEKLGYVLLDGISKDSDDLCLTPKVLRDGAVLCDKAIYNIACDVMESQGKSSDLELCSEADQEEIRKALRNYMGELPEYSYLVDDLFSEK